MNLFFILLSCFLLLKGIESIKLDGINVPQMVVLADHDEDGDVDEDDVDRTILDCNYKVEPSDGGSLVVKWYKDNEVIRQWIRGQTPTVFPPFKSKIDESYEASEDPNYKYKSIRLENLSIEDSGMYKCVVQTFLKNYQMEKFMQVIDISNMTMSLNSLRKDNETHVECTIENVYPEPTVLVTTEDDEDVPLVANNVKRNDDGYYSGTTVAILDNDNEDDEESFKCILEFGDLPFNITESSSNGCPDTLRKATKIFSLLFLLPLMAIY